MKRSGYSKLLYALTKQERNYTFSDKTTNLEHITSRLVRTTQNRVAASALIRCTWLRLLR